MANDNDVNEFEERPVDAHIEALEQRGAARIPAGSPGRRSPDLSSLPASEKIRVGLRQLSEREGR